MPDTPTWITTAPLPLEACGVAVPVAEPAHDALIFDKEHGGREVV